MPVLTARQIREEFPITKSCTYLDSAYWGPYPRRTAEAISDFVQQRSLKAYPFGRADRDRVFVDKVRSKVAGLLGASPEEIWFSRGTTEAINAVASALLKPGDEILVGGLDHPADYTIWANLADRGVVVRVVPQRDGQMDPADLARAVTPRTRAIGMCLVNTYNGCRQDLEALSRVAQDRGLYLLIDAIQGIGHLNIDLGKANVTMMSAGAYKWLCSPEGLGVAYVNKDVIGKIIPQTAHFYGIQPGDGGWSPFLSRLFEHGLAGDGPQEISPGTLSYPDSAVRLEISPSVVSLIGLNEMADLVNEFGGMAAVESRVLHLATQLRSRAQEHGHTVISPSDRPRMSGITSVAIPRATEFAEFAKKRGIHVLPQKSPTSPELIVRVSPHIFNDDSDIDTLVDALDDFRKS